jgi:hypothetical protein
MISLYPLFCIEISQGFVLRVLSVAEYICLIKKTAADERIRYTQSIQYQ